ncbi:hypothetical protein OIDMADRAFT_36057 [Oidiodendron maius Zn]|uniref:Uncharacterized protein n=1 Tax=Oidiodendron maius (strain Zn) TaxID=913774 RepID=A0A0C3GRR1_OIDMZ|nr:hypothetical protein OIDMADRAFT_36057 [Oidiodendron maius Zn]
MAQQEQISTSTSQISPGQVLVMDSSKPTCSAGSRAQGSHKGPKRQGRKATRHRLSSESPNHNCPGADLSTGGENLPKRRRKPRGAHVFGKYKHADSLWMQEAQRSINGAISELDQQAAKLFEVKSNLSKCMDDMLAENTKLCSKLRGLGTYIADCGVKAETATKALARM